MKQIGKLRAFMLLSGFLLLGACHHDNNNTTNGYTYIQYINASPAHDHTDFYLTGGGETYSLTDVYYELGTAYGKYKNGNVSLKLEDFAHGTFVSGAPLNCVNDQSYTFILYDSVPNIKYLFIADTVPTNLQAGKGAIKFVNVSPNAGPVSYRLQGGAVLASNVQYAGTNAAASHTSFISVDAGWPVIEVLDANTQAVIDSMPLYTLQVEAGKSYTVWTGGYRGATNYPYGLKTFWTYDEIVP